MKIKFIKKLINKYINDNENIYNIKEFKETLYNIYNIGNAENFIKENETAINNYLENYYYLTYDLIIILNNKYNFNFDNINLFFIKIYIKKFLIKNNNYNDNYNLNINLFYYLLNNNPLLTLKRIIIYIINEYNLLLDNEIFNINKFLDKILL